MRWDARTAINKGCVILRDAKLNECSHDKDAMSSGGSYKHDDVIKALLRLDRPETRPGTNLNTANLVYFNDPESGTDAKQNCSWHNPGEGPPKTEETPRATQIRILRGWRDQNVSCSRCGQCKNE